MERADIEVEVLYIDPRKADYILAVHGVRSDDVYEVLYTAPRFFVRSRPAGLFNMIRPNRAGRFLIVGMIHVVANDWRVVTAHWNNDGRAKRNYEG